MPSLPPAMHRLLDEAIAAGYEVHRKGAMTRITKRVGSAKPTGLAVAATRGVVIAYRINAPPAQRRGIRSIDAMRVALGLGA